jgi:hypothetical protein
MRQMDIVIVHVDVVCLLYLFVCWCLTPLTTIFQLYGGSQFYWWRKPEKYMNLRRFTRTSAGIKSANVMLPWSGYGA